MPVSGRLISNRTMPGMDERFSTTVIGWPMQATVSADHPPTRSRRRLPSKGVPDAPNDREPVPWRTIWAAIASVAVTYLAYQFVLSVGRILTYLAVALFFAVVLTPPVDFLQRRLRIRRGLAATIVLIIGLILLALLIYALVRPVAQQAT